MIEKTRNAYKHMLRPLLVEAHSIRNIAEFIETVGNELFSSRPANMAYICIFMEFVCEIHDQMDSITMELLIFSAANVIEKTNFYVESKSLFRVVISEVFNILIQLMDTINQYIFWD